MEFYALSNIGGRSYMEDTFCLENNFAGKEGWHFGGVFDGHRGREASQVAKENMAKVFGKNLQSGLAPSRCFQKTFHDVSRMVKDEMVGCTALSFFIKNDYIWIANAGDGRMIESKKDSIGQITDDHQLSNNGERIRILEAGGEIREPYVFRGSEGLMPTRSLGDKYFRLVGVISVPDIFRRKITKDTIGFVLATDGLWEAMPNDAVGEILKEKKTAKEAAEFIMAVYLSIEPIFMLDNMTLVVIKI